MRKVIFYGPLGIAKHFLGGGEAGNKRTLGVLENAGYSILVFEKPYLLDLPYIREIVAPFQFSYKIVLLIIKRFGKYKDANVFHLSGFYFKLMFFEYLFISIAKTMGLKTVYEIRAGGMINAYNESGKIYKKLFYWTIKKSDLVLCQGREYCEFLLENFAIDSYYYPNYIQTRFISEQNQTELRVKNKIIELVYFGRFTDAKRIDFIIQIAYSLKLKGLKFKLNLIGYGKESYIAKIDLLISNFQLSNEVIVYGRMNLDEMSKILKKQHFFLFPSDEIREGHSNALTEAMSFGIVPLVSSIGFNRSIVNEDQLVIDTDDPNDYANKVIEVFNNSSIWMELSNKMHSRIIKNYTEPIVSKSLVVAYNTLF
jgi:glycosyltransferase involved in cell wall biosynthesis